MPPELVPAAVTGQDIEIVGYLLPETDVSAGDYIPFTLAMRAPQGTNDFYVPVLQVGDLILSFYHRQPPGHPRMAPRRNHR